MFAGLGLALFVSILVVLIHYESLRLISALSFRAPGRPRLKILYVILSVLLVHVAEALVYAGGFALGAEVFHLGRFEGAMPPESFFQYAYFSLETYTTQSVGDLYPVGALRILASFEPLVGLILISWSASLTFVAMRRYWRMGPEAHPGSSTKGKPG